MLTSSVSRPLACPAAMQYGARLEVVAVQHEGAALLRRPLVGVCRQGRHQRRQPVAHLARCNGPLKVALAVAALQYKKAA